MLALSSMINSLSDVGSNSVHRTAHDKFWNINLQLDEGCDSVRSQESDHKKGPAANECDGISRQKSFFFFFWFCFKKFYRRNDVFRVKICFALETLMVFPLFSPPNVFIIASLFKGHHSEGGYLWGNTTETSLRVCSSAFPPKALKWATTVCITNTGTGKQLTSYKEEGQRTRFPTHFPFLVYVLYTCSSFTKISENIFKN